MNNFNNNNNITKDHSTTCKSGKNQDQRGKYDEDDSNDEEYGDEFPPAINGMDDEEWDCRVEDNAEGTLK